MSEHEEDGGAQPRDEDRLIVENVWFRLSYNDARLRYRLCVRDQISNGWVDVSVDNLSGTLLRLEYYSELYWAMKQVPQHVMLRDLYTILLKREAARLKFSHYTEYLPESNVRPEDQCVKKEKPSKICPYCGWPKGSSSCDKSHP